jgi:5-methylcytosine-specific restriction endonuclease McrA
MTPDERHQRKVRSSRPWARTVARVLRTKGTVCHLCGKQGATSADHVVPVSHGGTNDLANLEPVHPTCNTSRGNRSVQEARIRLTASAGPDPHPGWWHLHGHPSCCPHSEQWTDGMELRTA